MRVIDLLRKAGLVAVEGESAPPPDPEPAPEAKRAATPTPKEAPRPVHLPPPPTSEQLAPLAAKELTVDFTQIYAALKLPTPPHGWNVEKVIGVLDSPHFQGLDAATRKAALLAMLGANQASPAEIVEDAARRDQALDAYENFARKKLADRVTGFRQAIAEEEERIRLSQAAIEQHRKAVAQEDEGFQSWLERKLEQEETLARVVALLTDQSVITVGPVHPTAGEQQAVRDEGGEGRSPTPARKKS
ncbi:MAG: hypothetical protein IPK72_04575 [Candidatus Eisenbacteria bacterium]|nr:hypothetical protein [Candidatus Eisenbacteria bacterium]